MDGLEEETHEEVGPEGLVQHLKERWVSVPLGRFDNQGFGLLGHILVGAAQFGQLLWGVHWRWLPGVRQQRRLEMG